MINDGSTDAKPEKLAAVEDSRLKVFTCENSGLAITQNRRVAHAFWQFLSFLDAIEPLRNQNLAHACRFHDVLYLSFERSRQRIRRAFQRFQAAIELDQNLLARNIQPLLVKLMLPRLTVI